MNNLILKRMIFAVFVVCILTSPPVFLVFAQELDPNLDSDGDGLTDWDEINRYWSDPEETDTDGDLIDDGKEVRTGTMNKGQEMRDERRASSIELTAAARANPAGSSKPMRIRTSITSIRNCSNSPETTRTKKLPSRCR